MGGLPHETVNNHIKHLATSISATFVYAGIDVEGSGFVAEGRSTEKAKYSQTAHRFKKFNLLPFDYNNTRSKKHFLELLASFEDHLLLFDHLPHALAEEAGQYIWARTGGYIGPISTLMREAVAVAIKQKKERITLDILKSIKLDFQSEQQFSLCLKQQQAAGQRTS